MVRSHPWCLVKITNEPTIALEKMPRDGHWQPSNLLVPILHAAYDAVRLSASKPFNLQGLALEKSDAEYEAKNTWILRWTADISTNQHLSTVLYCDRTAKQCSILQFTMLSHSSPASAFLQCCVQFNYGKTRARVPPEHPVINGCRGVTETS